MKKTFGLLISIVVILTLVGSVFAAPPGSGWYTGITFQNVGTGTATVDVIAYGANNTTATASLSILQNEAKGILPTDFSGMNAGFQGGAIVSSSQELRSIVNVTNRYLAASGLGDQAAAHPAAAQYQGMSTPSTTLLFPLVKTNFANKSTTFYVQNAGTAAAGGTATFVFNGVSYTYAIPSLNPGQTAVFSSLDARDGGGNAPVSGGTLAQSVGALTVVSTQPLAGTFLEHKTFETNASLLQSTRAFTPADAASTLYVPVNKDNFNNRFTGLQVQNVGPGSVNVTTTYTGGGGSCAVGSAAGSESATIAEGASYTFASSVITGATDKCLASAKVEVTSGSGKLVGVVNESFTPAYMTANPTKFQESTTYFAFPGTAVTAKVSVPVYKEDSFNKATGVTIQNVGGGEAKVTITLVGPKGTFVSNPQTVGVGATLGLLDMRLLPAGFWSSTPMTPTALGCTGGNNVCGANGLMSMIVTADQPIVAIANESTYPIAAPRIQQDKNNYEGFNLVP